MTPEEFNQLMDRLHDNEMSFALATPGSMEEKRYLDLTISEMLLIQKEYAKLFREVGEIKHE